MDRDDNRNSACACLLYRAGSRIGGGIDHWEFELGLETDANASALIDALKRAYADSKFFLRSAEALRHGQSWEALSRKLINILNEVATKVIDPWESPQSPEKLVEHWKSSEPLRGTARKLEAWMAALECQWLDHSTNYRRNSPPSPIRQQSLTLFIASSSEGEKVARKLIKSIHSLRPDWNLSFWKNPGAFMPGESTLEGLESLFRECDFGLYILTADDRLVLRKRQHLTARGNVIFELGLGVGMHGRRRSLMIHDDIYTISDLKGITSLPFTMKSGAKTPAIAVCRYIANQVVDAVDAEVERTNEIWRTTSQ